MTRCGYALALISSDHCEGLSLNSYADSGGMPTIGSGTTRYPTGRRVKLGETCTREDAYYYLEDHLKKEVFPFVDDLCMGLPLSDKLYAAICSLVYNVGRYAIGDRLKSAIKSMDLDRIVESFRLYIHVNGQQNKGLIRRRQFEIDYFQGKIDISNKNFKENETLC